MTTKKERAASAWETLWLALQVAREVRLERLGRPALREEQPAARINSVLGDCASKLLAIAEEPDRSAAPWLIEQTWEEYLRTEWGASLTPPFALSGFANVVNLSRCWRAAEARIVEENAAAKFEGRS